MAEALYLVTKSDSAGGTMTVNGVRACLINNDDGQTDAQIKASAIGRLNSYYDASGPAPTPFPDLYFDTVTKVSDLSSGPLKDNADCYVFLPGSAPFKIEGP